MRHDRKLLVRNLVLAMVAADAAGIYFLQDKLNGAGSGGSIEDEALAAAAQPAPQSLRELPEPSFGPAKASFKDNGQTAQAEVAVAPAVAEKPATPSHAKVTAAPIQSAATLHPVKTIETPAVKPAPRIAAATRTKKPVTLSVTPSKPARSHAPEIKTVRNGAKFSKAFSGLAPSGSTPLASLSNGSLQSSSPAITAQFSPVEVPVQTIADLPVPEFAQPDVTIVEATESSPVQVAQVASELPASGQ